jgi:phosphoribosylformimino-5-aminoimidazole carboxamide ribotide isomerase
MEIIPAIDIMNGKCVRLKRGNFSEKTIYHDDPVEMASIFHDQGLNRLHLVDLDGAKAGRIMHHDILEKIFLKTGSIIDFGGGIKSDKDVEILFHSGAAMITAGSIAVKDPDIVSRWIKRYGHEKIILGADADNGHIAVNAWLVDSGIDIIKFIENYRNRGMRKVICTDISRDGMMKGPGIELYRRIRIQFKDLYLIAGGGISVPDDLEELQRTGVDGVIIGKALYEQTITFKDLQKFIR